MWQTIFLIVIGVAVALVIAAAIGDGGGSSNPAGTGHTSAIGRTGDTNGNPGNGDAGGNCSRLVTKAPEISGVGLPAAAALLAGGVALIAARPRSRKSAGVAARDLHGD